MTSIPERYKIERINYELAMRIVIKNHYLHRKAPCSFAFGLFEESNIARDLFSNDRIVGVIIYGTPSSSTLRTGICGPEEKNNVIELTRLWIEDGTPKNTESYFIGNTIKKIDKEIVVSFAEIQQGHTGVIYQATNWIYTGLSAKRKEWKIEGMDKHSQTIADKYTSDQLKQKFGDKFTNEPRPRKHRYIYFNASKKRKKELVIKLRYKQRPYPKKALYSKIIQ